MRSFHNSDHKKGKKAYIGRQFCALITAILLCVGELSCFCGENTVQAAGITNEEVENTGVNISYTDTEAGPSDEEAGPSAEEVGDGSGGDNGENGSEDDTDGVLSDEQDSVEDTVSEDDSDTTAAETAEDTAALGKADNTLTAEAGEKLRSLAAEKDLMAVVYLTDSYSLRSEASLDSEKIVSVPCGTTVFVKDGKVTEGELWYYVEFELGDSSYSGYIQKQYLVTSDELLLEWEKEYVTADEGIAPLSAAEPDTGEVDAEGATAYADINQFPASYRSGLAALKDAHSNWTFVPLKTGLDFNTAVANEKGDKSWIYKTAPAAYRGSATGQSNWYYATTEGISYYMDPRNFFTESYIFQFEQLTYNASYHTEAAIQSFLNSTFMSGTIPGDSQTYAHAFFTIGSGRGISPTHLASRVYQEQGSGTSPLISGTYSGYEGYYNYFNVGATGSTTTAVIQNGLAYAKKQGWNTRYKSLEGGAATIGNGYILKGQDTIYLEKFNVNPSASHSVYTHQYMQNIQAPASESTTTKKTYTNAGSLNSPFVFKIPVYSNMPGNNLTLSADSMTVNKGETAALKAYVSNSQLDGSEVSWSISENTPSEETINYVENGSSLQVISIDGNGVITGNYPGTAKVTASWEDSDGSVQDESCTVTVKAPLKGISLACDGGSFWDQGTDGTYSLSMEREDSVSLLDASLSKDETSAVNLTASAVTPAEHGISTGKLTLNFDPVDTTDGRDVTWTSSNTAVAVVTADTSDELIQCAHVTAVGTGTCTVTASVDGMTARFTVTVTNPIGACGMTGSGGSLDIEVSQGKAEVSDEISEVTLDIGESGSLIYRYLPEDTGESRKVTWTSSDETVAVVEGGKVTGIKAGTATITAVSQGKYGMKATCEVKVYGCSVNFYDGDKKPVELSTDISCISGYAAGDILKNIPNITANSTITSFPALEDYSSDGIYYRFMGWYTLKDTSAGVVRSNLSVCYTGDSAIRDRQLDLYAYFEPISDGMVIMPIGTKTYTGSAIKPEVVVYDSLTYELAAEENAGASAEPLKKGKDYTVSYYNNTKASTADKKARVVIRGRGNYSGTYTVYFEIEPKQISDSDITVTAVPVSYTGKEIKTAPTVTYNGKTLKNGTDYTLSYPWTGTGAYKDAGTYPMIITGIGNYTGTSTAYMEISDDVLMTKVTLGRVGSVNYADHKELAQGTSGIRPGFTLTYTEGSGRDAVKHVYTYSGNLDTGSEKWTLDGSELASDKVPFTLAFTSNKAVGTATITIKARADMGFSGSRTVRFAITGTAISRAVISGIEDKDYTGSESDCRQTGLKVTYNGDTLKENTDYTVSYSDLSHAGKVTVTIWGMGGFTGKVTRTFRIDPIDLEEVRIDEINNGTGEFTWTWYTQTAAVESAPILLAGLPGQGDGTSPIKAEYVKGGTCPVINIYYGEKALTQGEDYTLSWRYNTAPTSSSTRADRMPYIRIQGTGNYTGTLTAGFSITGRSLATGTGTANGVTISAADVLYKNRTWAWVSTPVLWDKTGKRLTAGRDYSKSLVYKYAEDTTVISGTGKNAVTGVARSAGDVVRSTDIPEPGSEICVTATGINNYSGTVSCIYRVTSKSVSGARVTVKDQQYTGKAIDLDRDYDETTGSNPQLTVKVGNTVLTEGEDFVILGYSDSHKTIGWHTATIKGQGIYGGTRSFRFRIRGRAVSLRD